MTDLHIKWVSPDNVCASVRDGDGVADVHLHGGRWSCSCQALGTCNHVDAVMLVTVPAKQAGIA